jgi:hypothetical protein
METKHCKHCDKTKTVDNFYPRKDRKLYSAWCKHCTVKQNSLYRDKDKQKIYKAKYYKTNKVGRKLKADLKKYGLTLEAYGDMLKQQHDCCAMCQESAPVNKRLSVDHCHRTGKVRGLLCSNCNFILGLAKDSVSVLRNAVSYLEKYELYVEEKT